jgi:hypothetical protein
VISWLVTLTRLFWPPDMPLRTGVPIRVSACFLRPKLSTNVRTLLFSSLFRIDLGILAKRFSGRDVWHTSRESKTSCKVKSLPDSQGAHKDILLFDERRELPVVMSRYASAVDEYGAFGSWDTTCKHVEESRLTATRGSYES